MFIFQVNGLLQFDRWNASLYGIKGIAKRQIVQSDVKNTGSISA